VKKEERGKQKKIGAPKGFEHKTWRRIQKRKKGSVFRTRCGKVRKEEQVKPGLEVLTAGEGGPKKIRMNKTGRNYSIHAQTGKKKNGSN